MADKTKVLCVDDHAANLRIRALFLEQFGCKVIAVEDHHSAIKAVAENEVDVVVIDYHLGNGATGEDVAHDVRALRPGLPMIMLSGDPNLPDSAHHCVDAVVTKGASNPKDLLELIGNLVSRTSAKSRTVA